MKMQIKSLLIREGFFCSIRCGRYSKEQNICYLVRTGLADGLIRRERLSPQDAGIPFSIFIAVLNVAKAKK